MNPQTFLSALYKHEIIALLPRFHEGDLALLHFCINARQVVEELSSSLYD
jgi:hypothetical protein